MLCHAAEGESLHFLTSFVNEPGAQLRIAEYPVHCCRQLGRISRLNQQSSSVSQHLGHTSHSGGDHRYATRHRRQNRAAQAFTQRAQHKHVSTAERLMGVVQLTQKVNPGCQTGLRDLLLELVLQRPAAYDSPVQIGQVLDQPSGRPNERRVVLFGGQRAQRDRQVSILRNTETCPKVYAGTLGRRRVDCGGDDDETGPLQSIADQRVTDCRGDDNDPAGSPPEKPASKREDDSPGRDQWRLRQPGGEPGQGDCVGIVSVQNCRGRDLPDDSGDDPWVEPGVPAGWHHGNAGGREPTGQFAPGGGDDTLLYSPALQLASQQPDLPLTSSPLAPRGDVNDPRGQLPGSMSAGRGRSSRAAPVVPRSLPTSPSSVLSSDKLNGLWR